jgi:hypothetical protein
MFFGLNGTFPVTLIFSPKKRFRKLEFRFRKLEYLPKLVHRFDFFTQKKKKDSGSLNLDSGSLNIY